MQNDFIIALAWPEGMVSAAGAWYDFLFARNGKYRVGHSAVVLIDRKSGKLQYFDFGRYHSPPNYGVCGTFNGYASAHVSCMSGSTGAPFFCEDNSDVISCMKDYNLSGYNQPPGTVVCGCTDWEELGIDAPTHVPCETTDKNWEEKSLPFLKFLKKGCPLSFVFAYDDFTGVVTCSTATKYTIEFCPNDSEKNFFGSK